MHRFRRLSLKTRIWKTIQKSIQTLNLFNFCVATAVQLITVDGVGEIKYRQYVAIPVSAAAEQVKT